MAPAVQELLTLILIVETVAIGAAASLVLIFLFWRP